jgi:UDP-glucuronate 4-epimerase
MTQGQTILITGAAGFIGSTLSQRLIGEGHSVVGFDNFCDFYDPALKRANLAEQLDASDRFTLIEGDIRDRRAVLDAFDAHQPTGVIHIAAMAGVRPSIEQPDLYTAVNLDGTVNVLDAAVKVGAKKMLFASSSSVYGNNDKVPFGEDDPVDYPISPYAATKRSGELICHTYSHLYGLPIFCLRFFTVFGPRQRPDLAISKFLRMVDAGQSIPVFGDGTTSRDYTYVDDIVDGITAAYEHCDRFRIYNLGGSSPVTLTEMIETIEHVVGKPAIIDRQPMQPGDVERTFADVSRSHDELGYSPKVSFTEGIARHWAWMQRQG